MAILPAPERRTIAERLHHLELGDQESDLRGGYAERTFKLPTPVYFLPRRTLLSSEWEAELAFSGSSRA